MNLLSGIGFEEREAITLAFGAICIEVALYHGAFSPRFPKALKFIYLAIGIMFSIMSVITVGYALYKKTADRVQYTERSVQNEKSLRVVESSLNKDIARLEKTISRCESIRHFTNCRPTGRNPDGTRHYQSVGELEEQRRKLQQEWISKQKEITAYRPEFSTDDFFSRIGFGNQLRGMAVYANSRAGILELAALLFLFTFYFLSGKSLTTNARSMYGEHMFVVPAHQTLNARATNMQQPSGEQSAVLPADMLPLEAPQRPSELARVMADELTTGKARVTEKNRAIEELAVAGQVPLSAESLAKLFKTRPDTIRNQIFPGLAKEGWLVAYDQGGKTYYRKPNREDGAEIIMYGHYGWVLKMPADKTKDSFPLGFFNSAVRNGEYQRAKARQKHTDTIGGSSDVMEEMNGSEEDDEETKVAY